MQLVFEHEQYICAGANPAGYHTPDNQFQVACTVAGEIQATFTDTSLGIFENREFRDLYSIAADASVMFLRITYLPRMNVWWSWLSESRHRLAMVILKQDASPYLEEGKIVFRDEDAGATLSLSLQNPDGMFAKEGYAGVLPGTRVNVWFSMGNSSRLQIGLFFVDRIKMSRGDPLVQIEARNTVSKLLKDQTFDEKATRTGWLTNQFFGEILDDASVSKYSIQSQEHPSVFQFEPDKTFFDGVMEALQQINDWRIREMQNGEIIIGHRTNYPRFTEGIFSFNRDRDCFSREVIRDDQEAYSRICVHGTMRQETVIEGSSFTWYYLGAGIEGVEFTMNLLAPVQEGSVSVYLGQPYNMPLTEEMHFSLNYTTGAFASLPPYPGGDYYVSYRTADAVVDETEYEQRVYRDVNFMTGWNMPRQKTAYIELPENTPPADVEVIADALADRYGQVGQIETFVSLFCPHLQPGDEGYITEPGRIARTIGIVTQVEHTFGRKGFYTQFTIDSGGMFGKQMIKDYIQKVTKKTVQHKGVYHQPQV